MSWAADMDAPQMGHALRRAQMTVAGLAGARARDNSDDAAVLLIDYHQEAQRLGLDSSQAWQVLFVASLNWALSLVPDAAELREMTAGELISDRALLAARRLAAAS